MNLEECQNARAKRVEAQTDAASVLEKIGAHFQHYHLREPDVVRGVMEVSVWNWPYTKAGTRYDQTIICRVYADGGFSLALDTSAMALVDMVRQLEMMAKAQEILLPK